MERLKGKIALVTGGARGIGYAIAHKLAKEGATVVLADILEETAQESAEKLKAEGLHADALKVNVADVKDIYRMTGDCVARHGRIDILVNSAGVAGPCPSMKASEEYFDRIMDINIKGTFFCCQAAGRQMRKQGGGHIVNFSSGTSQMSLIGRLPYVVAKRGVNALTAVLGAEWAMYGIQVNAVAPGWINTALVEYPFKMGYLSKEQIMSVSPIQRLGEEKEIGNLVLYLCSDESSYIVGQTIFSDGGWNTGILPNALDYIKENDTMDY